MFDEDTIWGGAEVFLAKEKKGAATLSTAYAVFRYRQLSVSDVTQDSYNLLMVLRDQNCRTSMSRFERREGSARMRFRLHAWH